MMTEEVSYKAAGVDIDAGNALVDRLKKIVPLTHRPGVLGGLGGFGGCFELPLNQYQNPVLVSATDGVGTKLRFAIALGQHDTIGIDLVAMCVNDLAVMGAEPLFFLDYFATGKLDVDVAEQVITGIAKGCQQANVALIGGETAEMPGMYAKKDYDLAGFCVGIIEKSQLQEGKNIKPGDTLIALASSGPHANGYSLIHHLIEKTQTPLTMTLQGVPLSELFLKPTRIYVKSMLAIAKLGYLKGAAHITGGGFIDNIPRILPKDCAAWIDCRSWNMPEIFSWLQEKGQLSRFELRRTFNCGVGMVICTAKEHTDLALSALKQAGEKAWVIGEISSCDMGSSQVKFSDE